MEIKKKKHYTDFKTHDYYKHCHFTERKGTVLKSRS